MPVSTQFGDNDLPIDLSCSGFLLKLSLFFYILRFDCCGGVVYLFFGYWWLNSGLLGLLSKHCTT
jgi:hypothetical protein